MNNNQVQNITDILNLSVEFDKELLSNPQTEYGLMHILTKLKNLEISVKKSVNDANYLGKISNLISQCEKIINQRYQSNSSFENKSKSEKEINVKNPLLVLFYKPKCEYYLAFEPIWRQLRNSINNRVTLADINCENYSSVCSTFNVYEYPTLKFFYNGKIYEFNDARTTDNINKFVNGILELN
jgi:thiol-disulfide isomerase/thioredoxin